MDRIDQINTFNRFSKVSRETIKKFEEFEKILINYNKKMNLVGKSTINEVWTRHFLDSFQVIDFIDKNDKKLIDIGSGAGFPGIVLAIAASDRKMPLRVSLIEKSMKKNIFLSNVIKKLNLNVEVICENIFEEKKIIADIAIARAFKPLAKILELIHNKVINSKKFFVFLGKTGKKELELASKKWDIEYKLRMSITSIDSFIIEIKNVKEKI
jgi:16S rRNA (guanine527-N7)-methyltransferase